jgi:hypothetical protein
LKKYRISEANPFAHCFQETACRIAEELLYDGEGGVNLGLVDELEGKLAMLYRQMKAWRPLH